MLSEKEAGLDLDIFKERLEGCLQLSPQLISGGFMKWKGSQIIPHIVQVIKKQSAQMYICSKFCFPMKSPALHEPGMIDFHATVVIKFILPLKI